MLADQDLTLHISWDYASQLVHTCIHKRKRTSSLQLRLRRLGQLLVQESMLSVLLEWSDKMVNPIVETILIDFVITKLVEIFI